MGKGTVDWNSQETWQRVIAAIMATGVKIDLKQTAVYFGTTYDTLENRFRKIKKEATVLKEEAGDAVATPVRKSALNTPRKPKDTPKKDVLNSVSNGRVSKTPKGKNSVKQESVEQSFEIGNLDDIMLDTGYSFGRHPGMGEEEGLDDSWLT